MAKNKIYFNKPKIVDWNCEVSFELEQCFCSCSVEIDKHHKSCPNYNKPLNKESKTELTLIFEDGRKLTLVDFKIKNNNEIS